MYYSYTSKLELSSAATLTLVRKFQRLGSWQFNNLTKRSKIRYLKLDIHLIFVISEEKYPVLNI